MTLDQLITDLTALAATNGAPAHVARYVLELARVVAEMRQAVEDNAVRSLIVSSLLDESRGLRADVQRLTKELASERLASRRNDELMDELRADRDTWKAEAEKLRTSAEAAVVERIAKWLECKAALCTDVAHSNAVSAAVVGIRNGTWKETAQ